MSAAPPLTRDSTGEAAFARIGLAALEAAWAERTAVCAGDQPEPVHQMRVGLRRLRAACKTFARLLPAEDLARRVDGLRWLASRLGPAREWDVLATELLPPISAGLGEPGQARLAALAAAVAARRSQARAAAIAALNTRRAAQIHASLHRWLGERGWRGQLSLDQADALQRPVAALAPRLLGRLHRAVLRRGAGFDSQPAAQRHRVRIALKALRYGIEFLDFAVPDPPATRAYLRALKALQDGRGTLNDAATTERLLIGLCDRRLPLPARDGVMLCLGWQARALPDLDPRLRRAWAGFIAVPPPWRAAS